MTQSSVRTVPARSGDMRVSAERRVQRGARTRSPRAGRRRWLLLVAILAVVALAILANIGPLTHYKDASARLGAATARVDTLEAQKTQLQGELAKLSETGHLETLARQQLTYARPDEDLYIITGTSTDASGDLTNDPNGDPTGAGGQGVSAPVSAMPVLGGGISVTLDPYAEIPVGAAGTDDPVSGTDPAGAVDDDRGFFEGIISAIRGLF